MNEKNVNYLKDQIKYTGFGENLSEQLTEKIAQQLDTFSLEYQRNYDQSTMEVELYFSKSLTHDMYFFNAYVVNLRGPAGKMSQTFYINKGNNITLKEAFNLMNGRAVHKRFLKRNGDPYICWVQLDPFTTIPNGNFKLSYYHENYGFNLNSTLSNYPILEMEHEEFKESIITSLQKGNLQLVTFEIDGKEEVKLIEANPKFKSITIYNENREKEFWQSESSTVKNVAEETQFSEEKTQEKKQAKRGEGLTKQVPKVEENAQIDSKLPQTKRNKRPRTTKKV
ncbi:hypothetical protein [Galbibacter sp.]|uniref:hypothetical protein n=1 Tax=Galbibacter sp. TaxID=2918471 RepID=UPI003A8D9B72